MYEYDGNRCVHTFILCNRNMINGNLWWMKKTCYNSLRVQSHGGQTCCLLTTCIWNTDNFNLYSILPILHAILDPPPPPSSAYGNVCAQKHKKNKCIRVKLLCVVFVYIDNIHLFWFCFVVRSKLYIVCLHSPRLEISMRPASWHHAHSGARAHTLAHAICALRAYVMCITRRYTTNILSYSVRCALTGT